MLAISNTYLIYRALQFGVESTKQTISLVCIPRSSRFININLIAASKEVRIGDDFKDGNVTVKQWRATCKILKVFHIKNLNKINCKIILECEEYFPNTKYPLSQCFSDSNLFASYS